MVYDTPINHGVFHACTNSGYQATWDRNVGYGLCLVTCRHRSQNYYVYWSQIPRKALYLIPLLIRSFSRPKDDSMHKKQKSLNMTKDVGVACQKVHKQGREDIKGKYQGCSPQIWSGWVTSMCVLSMQQLGGVWGAWPPANFCNSNAHNTSPSAFSKFRSKVCMQTTYIPRYLQQFLAMCWLKILSAHIRGMRIALN